MNAHIYLVTNLVNDKQYVGQTTDEKCRRGHGVVLKSAYKKHGKSSFLYEQICSGVNNKNTLDVLEKFWIKTMESLVPNGYNLELGGNVDSLSKESRAKISQSLMGHIPWNKGKPMSDDARARLSASLKGRKAWNDGVLMAESTKAKLRAVLKGRAVWNKGVPASVEARKKQSEAKLGKPSNMLGKKHSEEAIKKIRLSKVGKRYSEETKMKHSLARLGKKQPTAICPHCKKSGGAWTLPRWHFNNCKMKEH